jgi:hypothetical protein
MIKPIRSRCLGLLITLFIPFYVKAQQSELLNRAQVASIINDSVKAQFKISYPIFRVYKYVDVSGQYYCVLTESIDSIAKNDDGSDDTLHHSIRAIDLKLENSRFSKVWELNDFIEKHDSHESSIWFWTKFSEFRDVDNDGLVEPIIIYGTRDDDDIEGGRVKIMIYYKGQKIAIRHHDSDLDEGRSTDVDKAFYSLPQKLKEEVNVKIRLMKKADLTIFYDIVL